MRPPSTSRRCSGWMPVRERARGRQQRLTGGQVAHQRRGARAVELAEDVVQQQDGRGLGDVGDDPMAREPQRERQRALLALRRLRARFEPADLEAQLVAVRPDERDPALDLGLPATVERVTQRPFDRRRVVVGQRRVAPFRLVPGRDRPRPGGQRLVRLGDHRRESFDEPEPAAHQLGRGVDELVVEHVEGRPRVVVTDAAAQERVALLQHPFVVVAGRVVRARRASRGSRRGTCGVRRDRPSPARGRPGRTR